MRPDDHHQTSLFEINDAANEPETDSNQPTVVRRFRLQLVAEESSLFDAGGPEQLANPQAAATFLDSHLGDRPQEHMAAIYLDTRNRVVGWTIAFVGTLNRCAVEPRTLLSTGLLLNAAGFILAHNHPSGDPSPSAEDLAFTRRLQEAAKIIGVRLIDHIILGANPRWVSLKQRGGC